MSVRSIDLDMKQFCSERNAIRAFIQTNSDRPALISLAESPNGQKIDKVFCGIRNNDGKVGILVSVFCSERPDDDFKVTVVVRQSEACWGSSPVLYNGG